MPDELKDKIREGQVGKELDIESKLSLRDKQRLKKKSEEEEEEIFFRETGIKNESRDHTMANLIKKYNEDMDRYERKFAKMRRLEKAGGTYDIDDIQLTDDEPSTPT